METKRELPTRHNFLTEAVQNLIEKKTTNNEPLIDADTIITITSDENLLKKYALHAIPIPQLPPVIEHVPQVTLINPILPSKSLYKNPSSPSDNIISDDFYLKRHRKHELDEKKQKNREKERLKHGYYQQKQLVERIKTMEKSLLQSIVSSIRHRNDNELVEPMGDDEELYLHDLHNQLLKDALEDLARYETLGIGVSNNSHKQSLQHSMMEEESSSNQTTAVQVIAGSASIANSIQNLSFHKALQTEAKKQRERHITSFSTSHPIFTGETLKKAARRSTRHVLAFGQKLPEFEIEEFTLPLYILERNNKPGA